MWVYRKLESLQVVNREQRVQPAFWFINKREQIKIPSILKPVSFESLAGNDFSERCTQAEAHCESNLDCQLWNIDLVTVFDAIFTSRQTCEKLQCLYENLMSSYFRETTVLKEKSYKAKDCTQKYWGRTCAPDACFRFSIYLSVIFPGTFLQTNV